MKYLKSFNESTQFETDEESILKLLTEIAPWHLAENIDLKERVRIHPDGTVDVIEGSIVIDISKVLKYPHFREFNIEAHSTKLPIKFGYVEKSFAIHEYPDLESLEGCPHTCKNFQIYKMNSITSLKGGPKNVQLHYRVNGTSITSLIGSPEIVGGWFDVEDTLITSLEGCPRQVGTIDLSNTPIKSFIGAPEVVETFRARGVKVTSLEGIPKKMKYLDVTPAKDHKGIYDPRPLKDNKFEDFNLGDQPILELIMLFNKKGYKSYDLDSSDCKEIIEMFVESLDYNYVRGPVNRPYINLFRLIEAFSEFDIRIPEGKTLENYSLVDDEGRVVDFYGNPI